MRMSRAMVAVGLAVLLSAAAARAETTVQLTNVHLCCGQCLKAVAKVLGGIEGVKGTSSQKTKTVTITAVDAKAAQKAVDALAEAGFHGRTDSKDVTVKRETAPAGKVKTLTLEGIHNCCGQCNKIIKGVVSKVPGVTGDDAKTRERSLTVTGDFEAATLVRALEDAGFHVKVKK